MKWGQRWAVVDTIQTMEKCQVEPVPLQPANLGCYYRGQKQGEFSLVCLAKADAISCTSHLPGFFSALGPLRQQHHAQLCQLHGSELQHPRVPAHGLTINLLLTAKLIREIGSILHYPIWNKLTTHQIFDQEYICFDTGYMWATLFTLIYSDLLPDFSGDRLTARTCLQKINLVFGCRAEQTLNEQWIALKCLTLTVRHINTESQDIAK